MKNPHAVALGRNGGKVGGKRNTPAQVSARLKNLSKIKPRTMTTEQARSTALKRWLKWRAKK